jgi:hypothetical protein
MQNTKLRCSSHAGSESCPLASYQLPTWKIVKVIIQARSVWCKSIYQNIKIIVCHEQILRTSGLVEHFETSAVFSMTWNEHFIRIRKPTIIHVDLWGWYNTWCDMKWPFYVALMPRKINVLRSNLKNAVKLRYFESPLSLTVTGLSSSVV